MKQQKYFLYIEKILIDDIDLCFGYDIVTRDSELVKFIIVKEVLNYFGTSGLQDLPIFTNLHNSIFRAPSEKVVLGNQMFPSCINDVQSYQTVYIGDNSLL